MLLQFLPLIPIVFLFGLLSIRNWRKAVIAMLVWAMFEGAIRKWILPGFQQPILLFKDVILIFAYIGYYFSNHNDEYIPPKSGTLKVLLIVAISYCIFELFNPGIPSPLLGIYGLKNYIIYIPLSFLMSEIIKTRKDLNRFMIGICLLSLPISLLGLYQFSQPPASWVNQYLSHEEGVDSIVATFGESAGSGDFIYGRARAASTFSYIGGFVTYLLLAVPIAAALLLASVPKRRTLIIVVVALVLSVGGAATTGARMPFVVFAIGASVMLPMAASKSLLSVKTSLRLFVGIAIAGTATLWFASGAFSALEYRTANSDSALDRIFSPFTELYDAYDTSPLIGTGIGTNSNASISIMGDTMPWWLGGYAYEGEPARIMQELGFFGFTLVYLPKLFATFLIFGYFRRARSALTIATQMAAFVFVGVNLVLATVNNPTGGLMYWAVVGLAMAAHRVELREQRLLVERDYQVLYGSSGPMALA